MFTSFEAVDLNLCLIEADKVSLSIPRNLHRHTQVNQWRVYKPDIATQLLVFVHHNWEVSGSKCRYQRQLIQQKPRFFVLLRFFKGENKNSHNIFSVHRSKKWNCTSKQATTAAFHFLPNSSFKTIAYSCSTLLASELTKSLNKPRNSKNKTHCHKTYKPTVTSVTLTLMFRIWRTLSFRFLLWCRTVYLRLYACSLSLSAETPGQHFP